MKRHFVRAKKLGVGRLNALLVTDSHDVRTAEKGRLCFASDRIVFF